MKSYLSDTAVSAAVPAFVVMLFLCCGALLAAGGRKGTSGNSSAADRFRADEYGPGDGWNKERGAGIVVPEEGWNGAPSRRSNEKPLLSNSRCRKRRSPATSMTKPSDGTRFVILSAAVFSAVTMAVVWRLGRAFWKCLKQGEATKDAGFTPRSLFETEQDGNCAELDIPSHKDGGDSWGPRYQPSHTLGAQESADVLPAADHNGDEVPWAREQAPGDRGQHAEGAGDLARLSRQDEKADHLAALAQRGEEDDDLPLLPRPDEEASALPPLRRPEHEADDMSALPRPDDGGVPLLSEPAQEPGGLPLPPRHRDEAGDRGAVPHAEAAIASVYHDEKAAVRVPIQQASEKAGSLPAERPAQRRGVTIRVRRRALGAFVVSAVLIATALLAGCLYGAAEIASSRGPAAARYGFAFMAATVTMSFYGTYLYLLYKYVQDFSEREQARRSSSSSMAQADA